MKALIISLCIFLLIIILWFFILNHMDQSLHELIDMIENKIEPAILHGNWNEASKEFLILKERWNEHQGLYNLFIDEASIMEINYANARISVFIARKASILALSELSFVKEHLSALHENELISIENIL